MKILKIIDEMFADADRQYHTLKQQVEDLMIQHKALPFFKIKEKEGIYLEIKSREKVIDSSFYTMYVLNNLRGKIRECEIEEKEKQVRKLKKGKKK